MMNFTELILISFHPHFPKSHWNTWTPNCRKSGTQRKILRSHHRTSHQTPNKKFGGNVRTGMNGRLLSIHEIQVVINAHIVWEWRQRLKHHWPQRIQRLQPCGTQPKTVMPPRGIPKRVRVSGAGGNAKRTQVTFGNSVQIKWKVREKMGIANNAEV